MPKRGTQQNLRNFEATSLGLEPLAMVNAGLLFGSMKIGVPLDIELATWTTRFSLRNESRSESPRRVDTLPFFVNGGFGFKS